MVAGYVAECSDEVAARLLLQFASRRAECLVRELFPQIRAVAFALLDREPMRLTGQEISTVLNLARE
jgi:hypothetical protein